MQAVKQDACKNGHVYTEGSFTWQHERKTGRKYRRCRECANVTQRSNRAALPSTEESRAYRRSLYAKKVAAQRSGMSVSDARLLMQIVADEAGDMAHKNDERPSSPWNYLRLKPEAQDKQDALNAAIDELDERTRCFNNPDDYSDYDEERPPSVVEAAMLCAGCPVLDLCRDYAVASKDRGVWGGIRVTDNKKLIGLEVK